MILPLENVMSVYSIVIKDDYPARCLFLNSIRCLVIVQEKFWPYPVLEGSE